MSTSTVLDDVLIRPRHGPDVCATCFNLTDGYARCWACAHGGRQLDAMSAISYSVGGERLHHALTVYKHLEHPDAAGWQAELAALLGRHLELHERCLATAAGVSAFDLVATVPSTDPGRSDSHPLEHLVPDGHTRLLRRTDAPVRAHVYSADRFTCTQPLGNEAVLVVDDTWTTGANAHSAAAALRRAGARAVAALVIGRYVNRDWRRNDERLRSSVGGFDPERCAHCALAARMPGVEPDRGTESPAAIGR